MSIRVSAQAKTPDDAGTLAVPVFSGLRVPEGVPAELDLAFLERRRFSGEVGETCALPADDDTTVLAVGVGDESEVTPSVLRRAAGEAARAASGERHIAAALTAAAPSAERGRAAQATVEGMLLGAYRFTRHKSAAESAAFEALTVVGAPVRALSQGAARGEVIARAVALARDLSNEPAGALTPRKLAAVAVETGRGAGLEVEVWDEKAVARERLGGLLGVAKGSDEPPCLIRMTYEPAARARGSVALVGKGITFDSGGLSLKTADGMMAMKTDMSGAAAVIAVMTALPALRVPLRVIGIAPVTENMPSGKATRPGDVLVARNNKTIEVLNTDAEGRLVLADGLALAVEAGVDAIVDLATLTGAAVQALGRQVAAVLGTSPGLVTQVKDAAERAGEPVWELPLFPEYRKHIDSEVADIKNMGLPNQNGTISAALFLREFVGDVPWAHLDIAGTARTDADSGFLTKGSTGFGVRLILELLASFRKPTG